MEEKKLDAAQQWAVDNGLVKDENWKGPISKHTMVSILYALIKRVFKM